MSNIVVSRFNEENLLINQRFRENTGVGCIYGTPLTMNQFNPGEVVFVIEMNLSKNRIEGVGLVLNIVKTGPKYSMYNDYNYNRYLYCGKYRLDRNDIETIVIEGSNPDSDPINVVEVLDRALFKGKSHMKRGSYFSRITDKLLSKFGLSCYKIQREITQKFVDKFGITIVMDEINYELHGLDYK
jgi:hypothetical protein